MFRAPSAHLQEDTVVHKQHMVPSLSIRVPGGLLIRRYRENSNQQAARTLIESDGTICCVYTTMSNILRININQCIKLVITV